MYTLPGNTDLSSYIKSDANITPLSISSERPAIILASNDVNDTTLFLNGLTQNIVILYDLFESMGYKSYLFQHSQGQTDKKSFILNYSTIQFVFVY